MVENSCYTIIVVLRHNLSSSHILYCHKLHNQYEGQHISLIEVTFFIAWLLYIYEVLAFGQELS